MQRVTGLLGRGWVWALLTLTVAAMPGVAQQQPTESTEIRDFTIHVDGKQAGTSQIVIIQGNDGTFLVKTRASVQVKLFFTYTYIYQGTEVWNQHQLIKLDGKCADNGKNLIVRAELDAKQNMLRVQANDREKMIQPEVWTTSYWRLPHAKFHNKAVSLLDADRGDLIGGQLRYIEAVNLTVAGKEQKCYHFQVIGPSPAVDLWFDIYHRLVRQEFTDRGHRTVIELANIQR
jgi:hypothetical protein